MSRLRFAVVAWIVLGAVTPARAQSPACTTLGQTTFVRDTLDELYYWHRELPDLDPAAFDGPEAFLDAARYRALDRTFSYVTSRASDEAFYSDSQFVGLGLSTGVRGDELRVLQVFDGSPAAEAGLDRGSRITAIDGVDVGTLMAAGSGAVDAAFGPAQDGVEVRLAFETRGGVPRSASVRKRPVTIPTVSLTRRFDVGGRRVGYLFFRNFVRPSAAALDAAFESLRAAGVDELVLDVRYNGGGLVDVAVHLASLVAGSRVRDQVFAESQHNDRNRRMNQTLRFRDPPHALGLDRLVVIATQASASASELVINGLRPFVDVTIVGDRTYGKPVGQYGLPFCDKVFAPVAFATVNADGQGGYFDGLAADCPAADDIEHELGDAAERSLAEALQVAATGACSAPPESGTRRRPADTAPRAVGWNALVNAR